MTNHPEFPQASPEMKYIIDQVAKIEDAHACSTGYYKSLGKVLDRLDKTDQELNQLKQINTELKDIIDIDIISKTIDGGSMVIENIYTSNIQLIDKADAILIKLDATTEKMYTRIFPPWWKVWGVRIIILCLGIGIGKLVAP